MPELFVFAGLCFVGAVVVVAVVSLVDSRWSKPTDDSDWYDTPTSEEELTALLGVVSPKKKKEEDGNA